MLAWIQKREFFMEKIEAMSLQPYSRNIGSAVSLGDCRSENRGEGFALTPPRLWHDTKLRCPGCHQRFVEIRSRVSRDAGCREQLAQKRAATARRGANDIGIELYQIIPWRPHAPPPRSRSTAPPPGAPSRRSRPSSGPPPVPPASRDHPRCTRHSSRPGSPARPRR